MNWIWLDASAARPATELNQIKGSIFIFIFLLQANL